MKIKNQDPSILSPETTLAKSQQAGATGSIQNAPVRKSKGSAATGDANSYQVSLSSESKDIKEAQQKAYAIAAATPDVREDRVASIKEQIANGSYKVDAGNIADGMLREAIRERLAENGSYEG